MPEPILIILAVVVAVLLVIVLRRPREDTDLIASQLAAREQTAAAKASSRGLDEQLRRRVAAMLAQRQKIQAIRLVIDRTGMRLHQAKAAVEEIERSGRWHPRPTDLVGNTVSQLPAHVVEHIRDLARRGRKIEAVKAMREHTGMGLAEAKRAVERL